MSDGTTVGWFGRFIRGCFWLLAAVIALSLAVDLVRSMWVPLVVITALVVTAGGGLIALNSWRRNRW